MPLSIGDIIAAEWERSLRETPCPENNRLLGWHLGMPQISYRERLDRVKRNWFMQPIPRIVIVRNNIRRLGKPAQKPRLP